MQCLAPAKVNLALSLLGKRPDGFHELRMINHSLALCDMLTLEEAEDVGLTCETPGIPLDASNLVLKAAIALQRQFDIQHGVRIHLEKRIPMMAGLGGGSADCAAAIKGLNDFWHLGMTPEAMCRFGATLGADVPYCLMGGTALAEGFGEVITPLPSLPPLAVLVIKPTTIRISTPAAFAAADRFGVLPHPEIDAAVAALKAGDFRGMVPFLANAFEPVIFEKHPMLRDLKNDLWDTDALYVTMSGSGPTLIAYYEHLSAAEAAAQRFRQEDLFLMCSSLC